jgi:hydrogenase maturation protease
MSGSKRPLALVVGVGNRDRGDDALGPEVVRQLRGRVRYDVEVLERSGDALALIEDWKGIPTVVVIDAVAALGEPGRIHRLDLTNNPLPIRYAPRSSHAFGVTETIELARSLGRLPRCLVAYLVEGERFEPGAPLSPAVADAVEEVTAQVAAEIYMVLGTRESV